MAMKVLIAPIIVIIILAVSFTVGLYVTNQTNPSSQASEAPIQSVSNYYLPDSRVFVVSANASYGNYPGPTITNDPYGSPPYGVVAQNGEPCLIINVTIRI